MGFMNLKEAAAKYHSEPMKGNIQRLIDFDMYHCLIAGSIDTALEVQEEYPGFPQEYLEWVKLCDGGLLFDTSLLSTRTQDRQLKLNVETYDEYNDTETYLAFGVPEGYEVFAVCGYRPLVCFNVKDKDGKVYQWDYEFGKFTEIWDTFADWLTETIDDGIQLIADGCLEPMGIKMTKGKK